MRTPRPTRSCCRAGRAASRVDPAAYPPPQYGEGVQAAIRWLRGEATTPPADQEGCGPYRSGQAGAAWATSDYVAGDPATDSDPAP